MNNISLSRDIINKCFKEYLREISFENFLLVYENIKNILFIENVIEHLGEIFEDVFRDEYLSY